jgi:cysteine desulfurase/selenocysteine lyase
LGLDKIANYENELLEYATPILSSIDGFNIIGEAQNKAAVISFLIDGTHPYDLGTLLDQMGIAIRTGHHCTEPLMDRFEIPGTARASFAFYNTTEEIDYLFESLNRAINMLR